MGIVYAGNKIKNRIYFMTRDTKNGMLGGVLAGISNSLNIPLSLLRV
jgi:phage shock protein PspC (stress-responsive transcriptional regulator)